MDSFLTRINVFLFKLIVKNELNDNELTEEQKRDFLIFDLELNKIWVEYFVAVYYQTDDLSCIERDFQGLNIDTDLTPKKIYEKLTAVKRRLIIYPTKELKVNNPLFQRYFNEVFTANYSEEQFNKDLESCKQDKSKCAYCEITLEKIKELSIKPKLRNKRSFTRGYQLELDRKEPNYEYKPENIVLSCYWCNNAKTDEFTYKEFKEIGKSIKKVWSDREHRIDLLTGD